MMRMTALAGATASSEDYSRYIPTTAPTENELNVDDGRTAGMQNSVFAALCTLIFCGTVLFWFLVVMRMDCWTREKKVEKDYGDWEIAGIKTGSLESETSAGYPYISPGGYARPPV